MNSNSHKKRNVNVEKKLDILKEELKEIYSKSEGIVSVRILLLGIISRIEELKNEKTK